MKNADLRMDYALSAQKIKSRAVALGFIEARITTFRLPESHAERLQQWLADGLHGSMHFFEKHSSARTDARYILPEAVSVVTVAMPYWTGPVAEAWSVLRQPQQAYVSRYALGRDYHKVLRQRLKQLAAAIVADHPDALCRPVVDSAPLAEVSFASQAGLGWRGKHSLLLQKDSGSLFFLGALITNLPLPADAAVSNHCGDCQRCINACPTGAIIAPYTVDARRCLSYLTIESAQIIPLPFRQAMGNRIYGCDDCQLVCPFNRFAKPNAEADFQARHGLDQVSLLSLLDWDEADFQSRMAGSPIYRIGYPKWLSNILIALGNAPKSATIADALRPWLNHPQAIVAEAAQWSFAQHEDTHTTPDRGF